MAEIFDLATTPLDRGVTLIEASAGTGKTFSLAGLILLLVAEEHIPIKEILAVTYTIAATAELKERVRERLQEALEQLRRGTSNDPVIARILDRTDAAQSIRSINLALQSFDEAQVFTIHSFCQRILQDYAFESGIAFDAELVTDPTPLFQEVARDFWRLKLTNVLPLIGGIFLAWEKSPAEWVELLNRTRNHPDAVFIPPAGRSSIEQLSNKIAETMGQIRTEWGANGPAIERILRAHPGLSRSQQNFNEDRVNELVRKVNEACGDFDCADPLFLASLKEFSTEAIAVATLKKKPTPTHRFFELCSAFVQLIEALFLQSTYDFLKYAETEIPERKARTNTVTFDDLILRLRSSLKGKNGERLAKAVGASYRAVLVDEFQDTDPAQYEIFRKIFATDEHRLYYIGDPKQAIYGFRGADVFTYLAAAHDADRTLTLQTNWRSEPNLVAGINEIFDQTDHPFVLPGIGFHEIQPAAKLDFPRLTGLAKAAAAPFVFRPVPSTRDDGKAMNKGEATTAVCTAVASEMKQVRTSGGQLGDRAIAFGDMAVLVRTHNQAEQMQEILREQGISSIVQTDRSVFASKEAEQLQHFLEGVLEPGRERLFKAALITSVVGLNGDELIQLESDEAKRQRWLDKFFEWRSLWSTECFIAAFRQINVEQNVRSRLVQLPGGERRLTNFLHLAELLHTAETAQRLQPDGLISWLRKQRKSSMVAADEFQLRLESDADAVQIVTIHKAKGLEYPIVFCPFLWTFVDPARWDELQFHDRAKDDTLTFSLRGRSTGTDEQLGWATEEAASEELRMLYVAITRAKNRCTIHVPAYQDLAESPLARLFPEQARADLPTALKELAEQAPDSISFSDGPTSTATSENGEEPAVNLAARSFTGRIDRTAMIASFSGLNSGRIELQEPEPEISDQPEVVADEKPTSGDTIFDFARGAHAGDFFHAILERVDFNRPDLEGVVDEQLLWHGFAGNKCRDAIVATLSNLLGAELETGLSLRQIDQASRISELEFTYRLKKVDPAGLSKVFKRCPDLPKPFLGNLERLRFDPVEGYMRGFIDLLFASGGRYFIVDWKSNWLGNRLADYNEAGMTAAMLDHNYFLQAHLYAMAADLFLGNRIPNYDYERHFGGVFYVFLRGVDPKHPKSGIFAQRPTEKSIEVLRELTT